MANPIYYEHNLPHYQPPNATYLVNIRLAGSLPREALARIQREYQTFKRSLASRHIRSQEIETYRERQLQYYMDIDRLLDANALKQNLLVREDIAELVAASLRLNDGKKYVLIAYCIMPNHVHIILGIGAPWLNTVDDTGKKPFPVTRHIGSMKKYTARKANALLARDGPFWQNESYDHVIRDDVELKSLLWYVLNNPVAAGLVEQWTDWKWTYVKEGFV